MNGCVFYVWVYVTEHRIDVINELLSVQFLARLEKRR